MEPAEPGGLLAGRYRLRAVIGRGGMGLVWLATDELLHRDVAVKEILWPPQLDAAERKTLRQRALREARTAARLEHPNIVRVYDVVEDDGRPWIVMQFMPYRSLSDVVRDDGPLPPGRTARIGLQMLAAIEAAHAAGVLHRDVKPSNVLLGPQDRVVLTDFGMAIADGSTTLTTSETLIGSPAYMAPERARGEPATPAADLWSLGATLYAAVEGRPPFDRNGTLAVLTAVTNGNPDPPRRAGPLWPLIGGLLRKDPGARPDAAEVERLLRRAAGDHSGLPGAPPEESTVPLAIVAPAPSSNAMTRQHTVPQELAATTQPQPAAQPPAMQPQPPTATQPQPPATQPQPQPGTQPQPPTTEPGSTERKPALIPWMEVPPQRAMAEQPRPARPTPARPPRDAHPGRRWLFAVIGGVAGIAAIAAVAGLLSGSPAGHRAASGRHHAASAAASKPPHTGLSPQPGPRRPATPPGSASAPLPAGFVWYHDPTGFSIGVPTGWQVSHQGHLVYVRDPNSGRFLIIDQTTHPKPDPLADWRQQEAARIGTYPGYHRIRLQAVRYAQAERAADWEFTYYYNGRLIHVLNRNILANAHHAYALYWSTPASEWRTSFHFFRSFAATFRPAGAP